MLVPRDAAPQARGLWLEHPGSPTTLTSKQVYIYPHSDALQEHKTQEEQVLTSDFLMVLYSKF